MGSLKKIKLSAPYTVNRSLPQNIDKSFVNLFKKDQVYDYPLNSYIYTYRNCYITHYGPLLERGYFAPILTSQMKERPVYLIKLYLSCLKKICQDRIIILDKKCIVVHNNHINNYYHWVTEIFFRLYLVRQYLSDHTLILPKTAFPFQDDMLALLREEIDSIQEIGPTDLIKAKELVSPSYLADYGNYHPQLLREFASWILSRVIKHERFTKGRNIYITRNKASYRRVVNEDDLLDSLKKFNIEIINLEDLSFVEQVNLFYHASTIVAPHGAGLTNLIFCKPGTTIIELFPDKYVHTCYYTLADAFNLSYFYIIGKSVKETDDTPPFKLDMEINVKALCNLMEKQNISIHAL